ncbi:MAG: TusE/DsrC/DsvC family sulfur relay protein [Gammaproteobacteria bacterium]|nr:TusE/DsrC/DsvC family sulfur relay protein [Gammaproteobacteria bacterium]
MTMPPRDNEGYLENPQDWTAEIGEALASEMGISLNEEQWQVIRFVRTHFENTQTVPEARLMLRYMKEEMGEDKGTRKYLYHLFPHGYAQTACKFAGMRKPLKLMLDV